MHVLDALYTCTNNTCYQQLYNTTDMVLNDGTSDYTILLRLNWLIELHYFHVHLDSKKIILTYCLLHAQHGCCPCCSWNLNVCTSSKKDGASPAASPAWRSEAWTLAWVHWQQVLVVLAGVGFLYAQAGFSQTSSHLGRGHNVGFLHFQSHLVSSHIGVQRALGAVQAVRHLAGAQTVSHLGQSVFSHMSLGHLTLHCGLSQWILHAAHGVSSQCTWHLGRSHTGWHWAGHTGSSHCHLHSGWQSPSTSVDTSVADTKAIANTANNTNK